MSDALEPLLHYIDGSPSPYHAVAQSRAMLQEAGYRELFEADHWDLERGEGYFVTRGGKSLIAWRQGQAAAALGGCRIIAAHTDSPVLKLRPNPVMTSRNVSYLTAEIYGSPLLHTWLDRDLKIAGAVFCADASGAIETILVDAADLKVRAMSLAPHLKREKKTDGVTIALHDDLPLIVSDGALESAQDLYVALLGNAAARVHNADLILSDTQKACRVGRDGEFISAPRIDNLFSSFCVLSALLSLKSPRDHTAMAVLYDAEEIGSQTWTGARSDFLEATLTRIALSDDGSVQDLLRAKARSILISVDMAHAEHPSHVGATDPIHVPKLNGGLALKTGAKGNYAAGNQAAAWFDKACKDAGITLQSFMYRCDHGGGSSIGPLATTASGICGLDVGAPMLAMHSIRELAGAKDVDLTIAALSAAYAAAGGI
jgi:aspartyl aminopeptidase